MHVWLTSRRSIPLDRTLIMGILNVTPDSFSDGGEYLIPDAAIRRAEEMTAEGADILDIGGESTRPGSEQVAAGDEIRRVVPVIEAIAKRFDIPISVDTSKSVVAAAALDAGAEIVNDISGLRWDAQVGAVASARGTGLVLMHSRGEFATMHSQAPMEHVLPEVTNGLLSSAAIARSYGIAKEQIVLDIGIGFGKSPEQNLELVAKLDTLAAELNGFPLLVGASRKSFIAKSLGDLVPSERLAGSLASAAIAVWNGARILRVHDVRETVHVVKMTEALRNKR